MATMKRAWLVCVMLACACTGTESPAAKSGGTLVISTGGDPDVLIPSLLQSVQAAQIVDMVYDRLADIGDSLNIVSDKGFTPRLADRWTWSKDSLSIAFHLDPKARWHDGVPVRSNDVRFTVASTKDSTLGSPTAPVISNIDSVSTPDSATAVFWFHSRSPQQFYDAVYQLPIMPEHVWKAIPPASWRASDAARHPIGSGQYRFARWIPRVAVELVADTSNYRGAPKLGRLIWTISPDFPTAVTRFLSGEADFFEQLRPDNLAEVAKHPELRTRQYHALAYQFALMNLRDPANHDRPHPIFGNREMRRALTMAVDRAALVKSVYDTLALPALGPTVRSYSTTDPNLAQIPYDTVRARQVLDSLGWRVGTDGIRARNGRPLEFTLSIPGTSGPRLQIGVVIQEQLRKVGAKVDIENLDFPVLMEKDRKRTFDMVLGQWNTQPSPGALRGSWGTAGSRTASGNNYGSYESPVFDGYVDSALKSYDLPTRRALFTKAYETIIQDAPAIWLAEPLITVGYHSRLQLATLRPDAWWAHIPEWWIPADKRIARDNAPALDQGTATTASDRPAGQKTP
ncbi:MAG TPA: peptide ABC transporter substrate-binding protein [Gemmatimonadaceae bacterium]|jgi:peptide/nickel transport system substrate-binding protein